MRMLNQYMTLKNCWERSSSYDFHAHRQNSQRRRIFTQSTLLWLQVLRDLSPAFLGLSLAPPGIPPALPGEPNVHFSTPRCSQTYDHNTHGTSVSVLREPRYSEGRLEWSTRVWDSPENVVSKFTLHILSDTTGRFQRLKYNLLMYIGWPSAIFFKYKIYQYQRWYQTWIS